MFPCLEQIEYYNNIDFKAHHLRRSRGSWVRLFSKNNCDALCDLVPFVQFKNMESTLGGMFLLVKLDKWYQIAQSVSITWAKPQQDTCKSLDTRTNLSLDRAHLYVAALWHSSITGWLSNQSIIFKCLFMIFHGSIQIVVCNNISNDMN